MRSLKINKAILSLLIGFCFLLPFIGLVGLVFGYKDGHKGGGGGP